MRALPEGVRVAPSILSADFARLGEQVDEVMAVGAKIIHIDVMDGRFVPPITMGPIVVEALAERVHSRGGVLEAHLMIEDPASQLEAFTEAGADTIIVHVEATVHLHRTLSSIRDLGVNAGAAVCPATPVELLGEVRELVDVALVMSVNPGWGGQRFIEPTLERISRLRALLGDSSLIEVDGGIDSSTAPRAVDAGATLLVAGSAVFGAEDPAAAYLAVAGSAGAS